MRRIFTRLPFAKAGNAAPATQAFRTFSYSSALLGQVVPFKLADIGEGILHVEVVEWFVKPGDKVAAFDKLCEVRSDKANVEITSRFDGVVTKLYMGTGEQAYVGKPLVDIETSDAEAAGVAAPETPAEQPAAPAKKGGAKVVPFKLADIGEGILHVEVVEWFVKPGDKVAAFDKLCEVRSDKANVDITSRFDGVVTKLYMGTGEQAYVGKPLVDIETSDLGEETGSAPEAPASSQSQTPAAPQSTNASTAASRGEKVLAVPSVRRIAKENNINLAEVPGTGKDGRITKDDILAFIKNGGKPAAAPTAAPSASTTGAVRAAPADKVVPLTGIRKAMVRSMAIANNIPAFGASDEIDISKLIEFRDMLRPVIKQRNPDMKLSFMPMFVKAASLALVQYPELNAYTNEDCTELHVKGSHNIGFAMDTPQGLIVPNIKDCQDKSLFQIAEDMHDMMLRGKQNRLGPNDMQGGTFTLSNIGSIGATYAKPIIFPPQVAIGALGRNVKTPRFDEKGNVYAANLVNISWSADHRVVDGATMVRYSNLFRSYLENPSLMVLDTK